jgi:hypothetical protein
VYTNTQAVYAKAIVAEYDTAKARASLQHISRKKLCRFFAVCLGRTYRHSPSWAPRLASSSRNLALSHTHIFQQLQARCCRVQCTPWYMTVYSISQQLTCVRCCPQQQLLVPGFSSASAKLARGALTGCCSSCCSARSLLSKITKEPASQAGNQAKGGGCSK